MQSAEMYVNGHAHDTTSHFSSLGVGMAGIKPCAAHCDEGTVCVDDGCARGPKLTGTLPVG